MHVRLHRLVSKHTFQRQIINWQRWRRFSTEPLIVKPLLVERAEKLPKCPYLSGALLSPELHPFIPGVGFSSGKLSVSVQVLQPFLPFTNSQALKVQLISNIEKSSLPKVFILKLFDRIFIERESDWTVEGETELRNRVGEFLHRGHCVTSATIPEIFGLNTADGKVANVASWVDTEFADNATDYDSVPWKQEVWMHDMMIDRLSNEVKMYVHLSALQGTRIPRLYGFVQCVLDKGGPRDHLISQVPGIVLEYVDGKTLRELHVGKNISAEDAVCVSQGVLSSIRELHKHRVLHCDIRRENIIVREADRTPVIIDFVDAGEYTNATEQEWSTVAFGIHEIYDARELLDEQGLHSPTPRMYGPSAWQDGFAIHNSIIEKKDDKWRKKYVEPIKLDGPSWEPRIDDKSKTYMWKFARWKFKSGTRLQDEDDVSRTPII